MDLNLRKSNQLADHTCISIMKVWSMLCGHLSQIGPSTNVEWMHQPYKSKPAEANNNRRNWITTERERRFNGKLEKAESTRDR